MNGAQWPDGPRVAVVFGWAPAYCWLRMKRQRCQRKRWAAAIRCLPAAVFGPVLHPPWLRQRPLGYVRRWQGVLLRVRAPQRFSQRVWLAICVRAHDAHTRTRVLRRNLSP